MNRNQLTLDFQNNQLSGTSRDALRKYIKQLGRDDILKILIPFKNGLLHEKTKLYIDTT